MSDEEEENDDDDEDKEEEEEEEEEEEDDDDMPEKSPKLSKEQQQFNDKVKAVLGNDSDASSNAGSDLDEEMLTLDQNLSRIFRERKNQVGKRQKIELQTQALNFRLRLLDFVEVLASSRSAGLGLNRDQKQPKKLAIFLSILSKSLGHCVYNSADDSEIFQRSKNIIGMLLKKKMEEEVWKFAGEKPKPVAATTKPKTRGKKKVAE